MKQIEIVFRKLLLRMLILFRSPAPRKDLTKFTGESKLLFIRLNRIGDALVTTPLLAMLKKEIGCKITVLAGEQNHFIFEKEEVADNVIVFRKKARSLRSFIKEINEGSYDAVIDLHDDVSTTVSFIIAYSKCGYKFGLNKITSKLYTHAVDRLDPEKYHVVDRLLEFAKLFNLNTHDKNVNIVYNSTAKSVASAENYMKQSFIKQKFTVGVNISAGSEARFWGSENYKQLIALSLEHAINLVLLCSEKDETYAASISDGKIPVFHRKSFDEFCAVIGLLDLLFTPDTSIIHVASAHMIPVFGLFVKYKTRDMIWAPYRSEFDGVVTEKPTLKNISFDSVKLKYTSFLEKSLYEYTSKKL